jgi:hypothetical protein
LKKNFLNKNVFLVGSLVATPFFYSLGEYLQKKYGFDTPYDYFWLGLSFTFLSFLCAIVFFLTLALVLYQKFRNRSQLR